MLARRTLTALILLNLFAFDVQAQLACGPFVESAEELFNGEFVLGISYFGSLAIGELNQVKADLDYFKSRGFNNVRVWANWTLSDAPGASVLNANGTLKTVQMNRLKNLIGEAELRGMTVDVTFSWRSFGEDTCVTGSDPDDCHSGTCWNNFKTGIANVAESLADSTPPRNTNIFYDLANESNHGPSQCHTPGHDFQAEHILELANALHAGDAGAMLVTASMGGNVSNDTAVYGQILDNGSATFLTPHFARDDDGNWAGATGPRIDDIRDNPNIGPPYPPIHVQEPNRRNEDGKTAPMCDDGCQEVHFLLAAEKAAEYGAAGWVFHTDAGFRLDQGSFQSRLDSIEVDTIDCDFDGLTECLLEQVSESRCAPSPLVEDDFEGDPAGGFDPSYLIHYATDRGVQKWRARGPFAVTLCPANDVEECGEGPMQGEFATTGIPSSNATAFVPLVIDAGFDGVIVVEADLTVGSLMPTPDSAVMALGFLGNENCSGTACSFSNQGELWLEQTPSGVTFYDSDSIVGVMDYPNLQPTVRHWRLVYDYATGQLSVALDGGTPSVFGGPITVPSVRAVGFEILTGTPGLSGVDNFRAEVIP